ncbi:MAG: hypothetical protein GPJ52_12810 [Candidatus Heimdallarchaeota archaeon]|nr:hypothetical protein [Candidatus Heimdallarchaeota archaeon]MCG3254235.1 hypothetical protein [Candidatus Heimdallarchaeota archaeon]MCK4291363.1 hypothetical protein [Candidatus Heimdallarchaeota archaeon]
MTKLRKTIFLMIIILTPIIFNIIPTTGTEEKILPKRNIDFTSSLQSIELDEEVLRPDDNFGDQQLFWITMPDWMQVRATLLAEGIYCYIYMANETIELLGENESITKCEAVRDAFDADIYPSAIEVAGHPDGLLGDCDGDPKVTVFLAPLVRYMGNAYLGFINLDHENPSFPYTNLREMVFCDSEKSVYDTIFITIHEFNHLIWCNNDWNDCQFLSEGLANYAIDYAGYYSWVTDAVTNSFTFHPEISLLYFVREYGELWDSSYGQAYLFVTYLAERFGNDFTKQLVFIPEDGAIGIDKALEHFGYDLTFNDIYLDWITACVLDDPSFDGGIYGFETVDYTIQAASSVLFDFPRTRTHYYYGFDVKRMYLPRDNFTLVIDNPYPYALGVSIVLENESGIQVIKEIYRENSDEYRIYVEGTNLQNIYVITSLMSEDSPIEYGSVMSMDELISEELNYNFFEGNVVSNVSAKIVYSFLFCIPITLLLIRKKKRRILQNKKEEL